MNTTPKLPQSYTGRLRTFTLIRGDLNCGEGAQFSDGRVVVSRAGGAVQERYRELGAMVREWTGRAAVMWCGAGPGRCAGPAPRRFVFVRHADSTGYSGSGFAVEGVEFTHGGVALTWLGKVNSLVEWESLELAVSTHGHNGNTRLRWLDPEPAA